MSEKSSGRELVEELVQTSVLWGPPLVGAVFGPLGAALGVAVTVAIVNSGSDDDDSASHGSDQDSTSRD